MATRTRVSIPAREKRGTSPASHAPHTAPATTHHRTSPNASKTSSPAPAHDSTNSSDKHVPNYLKATHSSSTDAPKQQGKKPVSNDASHNKPNAARRKSLDKSMSHLSTHKPHVSPNTVPRSISSVGKTVHSSSRTIPDKNLKATKEPVKKGGGGGGGSSYGRPVKKKTIYVKKGTVSGTTLTTKEKDTITPVEKVENHNEPDIAEPETKIEEHASSVEPEEHVAQDDTNHEKEDDFPQNEDKEVINVKENEEETDKDANIVNVESPTETEKNDPPQDVNPPQNVDPPQDAKTEQEPEEKMQIEETGSKNQEFENDLNETSVTENHKEVVEKKEALVNHKKEDVIGTEENNEINEKEAEQVVAKDEKKQAVDNATVKPSQVAAAQGKKDSAVSNGVIEECASKFREQRKNKVKALAGAFETVISLQENK